MVPNLPIALPQDLLSPIFRTIRKSDPQVNESNPAVFVVECVDETRRSLTEWISQPGRKSRNPSEKSANQSVQYSIH
jgi:hypothetical protein